MELQEKIMKSFIGKVVRKDLAFLVKGGLPVPTYVLEYLLGQYCASDDEVVINEGLEKVKQVIQNNYVHRADAETVKGRIRENGRHRIIGLVWRSHRYRLCAQKPQAPFRQRRLVYHNHRLYTR